MQAKHEDMEECWLMVYFEPCWYFSDKITIVFPVRQFCRFASVCFVLKVGSHLSGTEYDGYLSAYFCSRLVSAYSLPESPLYQWNYARKGEAVKGQAWFSGHDDTGSVISSILGGIMDTAGDKFMLQEDYWWDRSRSGGHCLLVTDG